MGMCVGPPVRNVLWSKSRSLLVFICGPVCALRGRDAKKEAVLQFKKPGLSIRKAAGYKE